MASSWYSIKHILFSAGNILVEFGTLCVCRDFGRSRAIKAILIGQAHSFKAWIEHRLFAKNNCRNAKIKIVQTFKLLQYEASHVRALLLILIPAHSLSL